jgi:hypothetical protein
MLARSLKGNLRCPKATLDISRPRKMMLRLILIGIILLGIFLVLTVIYSDEPMQAIDLALANEVTQRGAATGPLQVHPGNPRYFADGAGRAVYLTGSHTWNNSQDTSHPELDYAGYLRLLKEKNHNFMRLWIWEQVAWAPWTAENVRFHPLPYQRSGPGMALDGEPKFDLTEFNQEYFDRLRSRVIAARDRGIYVAVMLFQGWSVGKEPNLPGNAWWGHPFHRENNVNGIDGDLDDDGEGKETHTSQPPAVTVLQERYVRKVVDTLNDLDNVLWEISNEGDPRSKEWQYHMIRFIKTYEATKPKRHPVGMTVTYPNGSNADVFLSPADWISPNSSDRDDYKDNPPAADGAKVVIADTDHLWGVGGDRAWIWKSFTRGLNPIFMDPIDDPQWESARQAMGHTLAYANRMNLEAMTPRVDLASSGYCLANPGEEYLIYLPFEAHWLESARFVRRLKTPIRNVRRLFKRTVTINLSTASGKFLVEWFNPANGDKIEGRPVEGGTSHSLTAPFRGDAVLYVRKGTRVAAHVELTDIHMPSGPSPRK